MSPVPPTSFQHGRAAAKTGKSRAWPASRAGPDPATGSRKPARILRPMASRPYLSIVIPVFNEAGNVVDLHRELTASLEPMGRPYEILLVDDGSVDGTLERLLEIEARDGRVRVLRLRRNFGQTAAFSAGFDHARGEVVVTSDGDLQNDPADIPRLVARLEEGAFDLVCGWRQQRRDPASKRLPSWFANRLISWATGVHLRDYGCSLKAIRSEVVRNLRLYG